MSSIYNNMERRLDAFHAPYQRKSLETLFGPTLDGSVSQNLVSGALAIVGAGNVAAKTTANIYSVVDGVLVYTAAATMPVLTGFNVGAGKFGVCLFVVDQFGTVSTLYSDGTAAAIGNIVFPVVPTGKACIGFILVTDAAAFTGNTTPLDTATTVYFNVTGDFNPGLIGAL